MSNIRKSLVAIPRPAWWLAALVLLYALIGFFAAPWLAERQLREILDERLALSTEVGSIYFNPFTFYARIDGLDIGDRDGAPLLQLATLTANFQPSRLALLRLQFAELTLEGMDFYFQRDEQGRDTLSGLAEVWSATAPAEDTEEASGPEDDEDAEGGLVPIQVDDIRLADLTLHVRDAVPATVFESGLTLSEAHLSGLSTLEGREGSNSLTVRFEDEARLDWEGSMRLNPLLFTGNVNLENFGLAIVSRYLQDQLPLALEDGFLNAALNYRIDLSGQTPVINLDQIEASIAELSVVQNGRDRPFLTASTLSAGNGRLRIPDNDFELDSLQFDQLALTIDRESADSTNLQQMIATLAADAGTGSAAAQDESTPSEAWDIRLQELALNANRITLNDSSLETPATLGVLLDLQLSDLSNEEAAAFPLRADLRFDSGGDLQVEGALGVLPALSLTSSASLQNLDLTVLQPYLSEYALLELESAVLEFDSELLIDENEPFAYRGDVRLLDLSVQDQQRRESLASMEVLTVSALDFSQGQGSLEISELVLDAPFARIRIDEDGSTNVGRVIKPVPESGDEAPESLEAGASDDTDPVPFNITVGRIELRDGRSDFTDLDLPIPFNADIRELTGNAEGFSAPSSQPIEFALEGSVDEYGLVQLDSSFNPFDFTEQSQIDLQFRNLDLPPLTPYTMKFAGRELANGNMDVDLSYSLVDGQLVASNQVVLRDLRLGEQVESPDAMDLPLDLALALLKDSNGVIDLAVPISGDVNSPDFDIGPAIRGAIANVLTNIVSAPFRLLGSLVGGGAEDDVSGIQFRVGRSDLAPPERQLLERLHTALIQRPELRLEIPLLRTEADRLALQTQLVTEEINARIEQLPEGDASLTDQRIQVIEAMYQESGLSPALEALRAANMIETSVPNPFTGEPMISEQLDIQAYVNDVRDRLIAAETVPEARLEELARGRADAVQEYLTQNGDLDPSRLQTVGVQSAEPDDDGWLLMEFGVGVL